RDVPNAMASRCPADRWPHRGTTRIAARYLHDDTHIQILWSSPMMYSDIIGASRAGFRGSKIFARRSAVLSIASMAMLAMLAGPCAAQNAPPSQTGPQTL